MGKAFKITCIALACVVGAAALLIGGYIGYVALQYYRIADGITVEIRGGSDLKVKAGEEYSVMSYNLGFGAYSPEYSFFMDTGVMDDGTEVAGIYAKGLSYSDVRKNVDGQIEVAQDIDADFCFFQEVDEKADRSYGINMAEGLRQSLSGVSAYAQNFHTAYLMYPFNDPIGKSVSGIMTFSKYAVDGAVRRSFPLTDNFIDRLFDLDRCFAVHRLPLESGDRQLVLINLHMSAYDEGGKVRAKQIEMLNVVLAEERENGNYVVAGGDFNHCLIADKFSDDGEALNYFSCRQQVPDWVKNSILHNSELAEGFTIAANTNAATCRGADIPYEAGVNYSTVIDGFIVSDNIEVIEEQTVDTQYAYSDHNPVVMKFRLI